MNIIKSDQSLMDIDVVVSSTIIVYTLDVMISLVPYTKDRKTSSLFMYHFEH